MQFSYTKIQLKAVYSHFESINWDSYTCTPAAKIIETL